MRVLVTGHLGYIGTVLTPMLLREGFEVFGIDSDLYRRCDFCAASLGVPWTCKDVRDIGPQDVGGFDAVVHLAALANDALGNLNPETTEQVNHLAAVRLAELSRRAGVERFLFASSCSTYGAAGEKVLTEKSVLRPVSIYARSKARAEQDLSQLAGDRFSPTFLRSATVYGVSPRMRSDLVLNGLVASAVTTGLIRVTGDGSQWRPLVHIEDNCRAFVAVLTASRELIHDQAFNVGRNEENYRVVDLARIVAKAVPGVRTEFDGTASRDRRSYRVNCDKIARTLTGFRPRWDAHRGVLQLCQSYRETSARLDSLARGMYRRIDHIRELMEKGTVTTDLRYAQSSAPGTG